MNELPENCYRFGNVFEQDDVRFIFIGRSCDGDLIFIRPSRNMKRYFFDNTESGLLTLIGITPTNLAEMAREKGERIQFTLNTEFRNSITIWDSIEEAEKGYMVMYQNEDESLEAFCMRVATLRKYI